MARDPEKPAPKPDAGADDTWVSPARSPGPAAVPPTHPSGHNPGPIGADDGDGDTAASVVLAGRYEVRRELARGGMGRVLVAWDRRLKREVAVKQLLAPDPEALRRFEREVLVTAGLQHPSIVTIHEAGHAADGEPFYVMPEVPGRSLHEAIDAARTLPERLALLPHLVAACEAIAYAHDRGVVHRDLKPANVLVGAFGETVVIDWGLAKATGQTDIPASGRALAATDTGLTVVGQVMGTPGYMAPEQARGAPSDARCDVYALGAMLWHLLTGGPPYRGGSAAEILAAVVHGPPRELDWSGVPPDLVAILHKAMAHAPADRYPTAQALVADLRLFAAGRLVGAHHYSPRELLARWAGRHRALLAVSAAAAALLALLGGVSLSRIIEARRVADAQRDAATLARDQAEGLRRKAELDRQRSLLDQAKSLVDKDPTGSLALVRALSPELPGWDEARMIAEAALAAGVADWELRVPGVALALPLHDGVRVALGLRDGRVVLFDTRSGAFQTLGAHRATVADLTASDDDRSLISIAQDGSAAVWSLAGGAPVTLPDPSHTAGSSGFLADGTVAIAREGGVLELWDPRDGRRLQRMEGADHALSMANAHAALLRRGGEAELYLRAGPPRRLPLPADLSFVTADADGRLMASSLGRGIRVVDTATGRTTVLGGIEGLAPDEHAMVGSGGAAARLDDWTYGYWAPGASRPARGHVDCPVRKLDPMLGDRVLFRCENGLELIDFATGARVLLPVPHANAFINKNGTLAAALDGDTVRLWDLQRLGAREVEAPQAVDWLIGATRASRAVAFGSGDAPQVWEVDARTLGLRKLADASATVKDASMAANGTRVAWIEEGGTFVATWDFAAGTGRRIELPGPKSVQLAADGAFAVVGLSQGAAWIDLSSGAVTALDSGGPAGFVGASAAGPWALVEDAASHRVSLWDRSGHRLRDLPPAPPGVLLLSEDGRTLVNARWTGELDVWNPADGSLRTLASPVDRLFGAALSPDGSAVVLTDKESRVWFRSLSGEGQRLLVQLPDVAPPTVTADGRRASFLDTEGVATVVDLPSGASWQLRDPRGAFQSIDVGAAGPVWLTARGRQLRLWDDSLPEGAAPLLERLRAHPRRAALSE